MDNLSEFIWNERNRYEGNDNNRFAFSIGQVSRYLDFLELCRGRHDEATKAVAKAFEEMKSIRPLEDGSVSSADEAIFDQLRSSTFLVQYEVECFFLFAKILLDKVSLFIWDYFGQEQGLSLRSHSRLTKHLPEYALKRNIQLPTGIVELASSLKSIVGDFRDKQIAHLQSPRSTKGVSYNHVSERLSITTTRLYPKETDPDQIWSTPIGDVMDQIEQYLHEVTWMVENNRTRSKFKLAVIGQ
jgi:hypothetical protein